VESPFAADDETGPRCGVCRRVKQVFERAIAFGSYDGVLRDLIHLLKYENVRPAALVLGRRLAEVLAELPENFRSEPPVVIPVPLHPSRLRQRGFNQAELIARAALNLQPWGVRSAINATALVRRRATGTQTGLTPHQRRQNIRGAFRLRRVNEIAGRDIVLVDDVFTTGTTVTECARVLLRGGARGVWVATVARVLKSESAAFPVQSQPAATMAARA
jgi:ComF family protein